MIFKRLFKTRNEDGNGTHRIPDGHRVYAVGDIHGRLDLLEAMLEKIDTDDRQRSGAETSLIFLGDLVDRGPDSKAVIERLLNLRSSGRSTRFLMGNHDEIFLKAATGDVKAVRFLTRIGGRDTILSYGVTEEQYGSYDFDDLAEAFAKSVPQSHIAFVEAFEDYVAIGDYLFVHAGIRPGVAIEQQSASELRWIRREFLESRASHGAMVVHGHSISPSAQMRKNRIGIDTGAFASGRLTALGLEGTARWLLTAEGEADPRWGDLTD